jgi:HlyD family secretion protein
MKYRLPPHLPALIILVAFSLSGCSVFAQSTPQALPTIVLGDQDSDLNAAGTPAPQRGGGGVKASGVVAPAQQAQMVFTLPGKVESVDVQVGDRIESGQVLMRLAGKQDLLAAIARAEFDLAAAQKDHEDLARSAADRRTAALERISNATKAVRDATYQLDNFTVPSNQATLDTRAALDLMESKLDEARLAFEPYRYYPSTNDTREDLKEKLDAAQADYNAAVKRLQYETELEVAQAELADALEVFETWREGPDPAELAVSRARLADAQAALDAARSQLDKLELKAPFAGTVGRVDVEGGEWVIAGQPVLLLADLGNLRVETTDLSERDVPGIEPGQPVIVYIEALGQEVDGQVIRVAPLADILGGDVVYKTLIELDEIPEGLKAGMSVEVSFPQE